MLSVYVYMAKLKLMTFLTYRFEVFTSLGTNFIIIITNVFLWKAAYHGIESVSGVNEAQMLTYTMMSMLLASFYSGTVEHTMQDRINQGDIAIDFFRPVNLLLSYLADDIGIAISSILVKLFPLLIVMIIFIGSPLPSSPKSFFLFLISAIFSFLILWLISALVAMLCFWYLQLGNVGTIKDGILLLLSGKIIPLWLFPQKIQNIIKFLPFQYIYQTPLSLYIGKIATHEAKAALSIQAIWVCFLGVILSFGWSRARKRVLIQGG